MKKLLILKIYLKSIVKQLFLILLIIFGFSNFSNADERVNLSCEHDETFDWKTMETSPTKPTPESLVIFPKVQKYFFRGVEGSYQSKLNKIMFTLYSGETNSIKYEYSLDKTTSVFKTDFYMKNGPNDTYKKHLTHSGKCKKTENLF